MKIDPRILFVLGLFASIPALACNNHPPDVSHERWLAQINQWNKEYDAKQAAKAAQAQSDVREVRAVRGARERVRSQAENPAPMGRNTGGDAQVRSVGRQPQSVQDERRARRYR